MRSIHFLIPISSFLSHYQQTRKYEYELVEIKLLIGITLLEDPVNFQEKQFVLLNSLMIT